VSSGMGEKKKEEKRTTGSETGKQLDRRLPGCSGSKKRRGSHVLMSSASFLLNSGSANGREFLPQTFL
jgi:hypothetical protein